MERWIWACAALAIGCSSANGGDLFGDTSEGADDAGSSGGEVAATGGSPSGGAATGGSVSASSGGAPASGGAPGAGGAPESCAPGDWQECSGELGCEGIRLCRWETYAECVCQPGGGGRIGSGGAPVGGAANGGASSGGSGSGGCSQECTPGAAHCVGSGPCAQCEEYWLDCDGNGSCGDPVNSRNSCGVCGVKCGVDSVCEWTEPGSWFTCR